VTLFAARESRDESSRHTIDWPGIATISVGPDRAGARPDRGNSWGWGSARIVALLVVAATAWSRSC
jgi:hypothetical protein